MTSDELFDVWYELLAQKGQCDSPGGAEYQRVRREWQEAGKPAPKAFILSAANRLPDNPAETVDLEEIGREIGEPPTDIQ